MFPAQKRHIGWYWLHGVRLGPKPLDKCWFSGSPMTSMLVGACWTLPMIRYGKHRKKDLRIFDAYYFGLNLILLLGTTNPEILLCPAISWHWFPAVLFPLLGWWKKMVSHHSTISKQMNYSKWYVSNRPFNFSKGTTLIDMSQGWRLPKASFW
jgi:hypothetical protein